jgi:hypothetical protein
VMNMQLGHLSKYCDDDTEPLQVRPRLGCASGEINLGMLELERLEGACFAALRTNRSGARHRPSWWSGAQHTPGAISTKFGSVPEVLLRRTLRT